MHKNHLKVCTHHRIIGFCMIGELTFRYLWCTGRKFLELTSASNILPVSLFTWIFESLQILTKSPETLQKLPKQFFFMKKLSLASLFIWYLCSFGIFVHLATPHIASKSLETLHTSPNHWLLIRELSFCLLWCTGERFLELTSASYILPVSFICLNFWKFAHSHEITWNFAKLTEPIFLYEKT